MAPAMAGAMKVTHHHDQHLVCLSSEEVALLIDLCHAGAFSDELVQDGDSRLRLERFLGEMQGSLFETAQAVWRRQRHRGEGGATRTGHGSGSSRAQTAARSDGSGASSHPMAWPRGGITPEAA